jgi:hypothetical protein
MTRRLFTLAAAASLVVCLASLGLLVRSHFAADRAAGVAVPGAGRWDLKSAEGTVSAVDARYEADCEAYFPEVKRLHAASGRLWADLHMLDPDGPAFRDRVEEWDSAFRAYETLSEMGYPGRSRYAQREVRLWHIARRSRPPCRPPGSGRAASARTLCRSSASGKLPARDTRSLNRPGRTALRERTPFSRSGSRVR